MQTWAHDSNKILILAPYSTYLESFMTRLVTNRNSHSRLSDDLYIIGAVCSLYDIVMGLLV